MPSLSTPSLGLYLASAAALMAASAQGAIVYESFELWMADPDPFALNRADTVRFISFDGTSISFETSGDGVSISADDVSYGDVMLKNSGLRTTSGGYSQTSAILDAGDLIETGFATDPPPDNFIGEAFDQYIGVSTPEGNLGWIRFSHQTDGAQVTIHDAAFESVPGQSIAAGAVPESTPEGLLALAAGLAVVRRRRQSA